MVCLSFLGIDRIIAFVVPPHQEYPLVDHRDVASPRWGEARCGVYDQAVAGGEVERPGVAFAARRWRVVRGSK